MKKFYDFFALGLLILGGIAVSACNKPGTGDDNDDDDGNTPTDSITIVAPTSPVLLEAAKGSASSMNIIFKADWEVTGSEDWFTVSPDKGDATGQKITITADEANTEMADRYGKMKIKAGEMEQEWYVVQYGADGISLKSEQTTFTAGRTVTLPVLCKTGADLKISGADWVSLGAFEKTGKAEEIGETGVTSKYCEHELTLKLADNPSENEKRTATITVSVGESSFNVEIEQIEGKYTSKQFYRNSVGLRFTATWCGWCPLMGEAFDYAIEKGSERFIPVSLHGNGSSLAWSGTSTLESKYKLAGYPSARFNGYAEIPNYQDSNIGGQMIIDMTKEATEGNPAITGIAAETKTTDNALNIKIDVTAIETMDYAVTAFLIEDGIVSMQQNYVTGVADPDYVHNFVVRGNISEVLGTPLSVTAGTTESLELSYTIPSNVNKDNAYVVVYVLRPDTPQVTEVGYKYYDYGDYIDNAIKIGLNEKVELKYEE